MLYLRIEDKKFSFVTDEIHKIIETDILITYEEHAQFLETQSAGIQYSVKSNLKDCNTLFDFLEVVDTFNLTEYKNGKIIESKKLLDEYMIANPLYSNAHGEYGYYTVTEDKINRLNSNYTGYLIQKNLGLNPILTWNEQGRACVEWTEDQYFQLCIEADSYVKPRISKQQRYEELINSCKSKEEVDVITIDYGE